VKAFKVQLPSPETGVEDYLKEKVRAGVDTLRDTTTLAYEDIRKSQVQGTAPDPQAAKTAGFTGSSPLTVLIFQMVYNLD